MVNYYLELFGEIIISSDKSWKEKVVLNGCCGRRCYGLLGLSVFIFFVRLNFRMWKIFGRHSNREKDDEENH